MSEAEVYLLIRLPDVIINEVKECLHGLGLLS
jgi:hypothetical protein